MKLIISPAKSLDFENKAPFDFHSDAQLLEQSEKLNKALKRLSVKKLGEFMKLSENLAKLNHERNQEWQPPFTLENAKQAIYAFTGDVYLGLDAPTLKESDLDYTQNHLRILSGLYGLLRPFDLIQAYRLEMGKKLKVGRADNLYQFWGDQLAKMLQAEMVDDETLVNLASNEYFKSIKPKDLDRKIVTPHFKDLKNGEYKMIGFFAKKARGMMVRYAIDHKIENADDLKNFDVAGYRFADNRSDEKDWVFLRDEAQ